MDLVFGDEVIFRDGGWGVMCIWMFIESLSMGERLSRESVFGEKWRS